MEEKLYKRSQSSTEVAPVGTDICCNQIIFVLLFAIEKRVPAGLNGSGFAVDAQRTE